MKIYLAISLLYFCLLFPFQGGAQLVSISGFVKNQSTGEIKRNATVFESVSGIGTITNNDGYYRLLLSQGPQKLEISSPGFYKYTATFKLVADTTISVELVPHDLTQNKTVSSKELKFEPYNLSGSGNADSAPTK